MPSRCARLASLLCLLLGVIAASAADRPISAAKFVLKKSANGKEKLSFVSKDPAFLFPVRGSNDDPSMEGSSPFVVELFAAGSPGGVALTAPAGLGWTLRSVGPTRLSFKNPGAPELVSPFRAITLKEGRLIKLTGRRAGLPMDAPLGPVAIRITTGSLRNCALFDGATVRRDVVGSFAARGALASAVADCSNEALGGMTPTTSSTSSTTVTSTSTTTFPTTTTIAGICGNGIFEPPDEECDQSAGATCPFSACGPVGFSTECKCCGVIEAGPPDTPCCDPTAVPIFYPVAPAGWYCIATRCDPPFTCIFGTCQANGECCSELGQLCGIPGRECCAGMDCRSQHVIFPDLIEQLCCIGDGQPCGPDGGGCCTGTCTGGVCDTCRPGGASCTTNAQCCSGYCNGGTCYACQAADAGCTAGVQCCSGSCNTDALRCNP